MMTKSILPRQVNRRIGQAMQDYSMLSHGDHVLVAVSGGVDSLVLAWLLQMWLRKAPIVYTVRVIHIDMGFRGPHVEGEKLAHPVEKLGDQLLRFGISVQVEQARELPDSAGGERSCFSCARQRRQQLFDLAREHGCNKIAFGHHQDDLIETLFLNMLYSGNISTMMPRQDLFAGRLALIRPLAYIEKHEVMDIAMNLGLTAVDNLCPLAGDTRRDHVRNVMQTLYQQGPDVKASLFASMFNVRKEYLP